MESPAQLSQVYRRGREGLREVERFPQGRTAQPDPGHSSLRCLPCGSYCDTVIWGIWLLWGLVAQRQPRRPEENARHLGEK